MADERAPDLRFRETGPVGAGRFEVLRGDRVIGTVAPFRMAAGQFGSTWVATTPAGRRSGTFPTRAAAAAWLVKADQTSPA